MRLPEMTPGMVASQIGQREGFAMTEHRIALQPREPDSVPGALDYRAVCEPCDWAGPWRASPDTGCNDGFLHCQFEDREARVIERGGRRFRVCAYEKHLWLQDWCEIRRQHNYKSTSIIRGRVAHRVSARLERAIRRRLRRPRRPCPSCKGPRFDINEVLTEDAA